MTIPILGAVAAVLLGIGLLYGGAEFVVRESVALAIRHGVPAGIVGATIVAFGTSLPEWTVSLTAAVTDHGSISLGNIVGSNLFNLGVLLALVLAVRPTRFNRICATLDIPSAAFAMVMLAIGVSAQHEVSRPFALILVLLMSVYLLRTSKELRGNRDAVDLQTSYSLPKLMAGFAVLVVGSQALVWGSTRLAVLFAAPEWLIAVTLVAIGTSLPELATTIVSLRHRHTDLGVGNMIGSNIWNTLFITGSVGIIKPIEMGAVATLDLWVAAFMGMVLLPYTLYRHKSAGRVAALALAGLYCVSICGWIF